MSTERVVLVTGGTSGIGEGLARRYAGTGARVVVTGRVSSRLDDACARIPGAIGIAGDLARPEDRVALAEAVTSRLGRLDVLVLSAGIQRRIPIAADRAAWPERQAELDLLLSAPVHLVQLLTPLLLDAGGSGQIVAVTSGGALVPQPFAPLYSAAKAALRSYSANLRLAFSDAGVAVTELIPPAVATALAGPGETHGVDPDVFCDDVFPRLERRDDEVGHGATDAEELLELRRADARRFEAAARRSHVERYSPSPPARD